ncbi:D-alanyl-D-alanine carboxypeptidase family protein [Patulibacter defluvii]|uniref:D-alanyl-D-alanine carboxypeptidase family protein n=1 Tax=Patulibacter defluvii TaxID=3095358 RepID=UPI002A755E7A|nr:D-alanyl-D-alanine carboxypeptidase family protein [Patulibacter sp. DM4]
MSSSIFLSVTPTRRGRIAVAVVALAVVVAAALVGLGGARIAGQAIAPRSGNQGPGSGDAAVIPDGESIAASAVDHPAIARLIPDLRQALAAATRAAADDGIALRVTSGWRSRDHQQRLLDAAIARDGAAAARRLVAAPDRSAHVRGAAVDIGPTDAAYWMQANGARFGLCQTFANEVWHYERRIAPGGTCPAPAPDAAG